MQKRTISNSLLQQKSKNGIRDPGATPQILRFGSSGGTKGVPGVVRGVVQGMVKLAVLGIVVQIVS